MKPHPKRRFEIVGVILFISLPIVLMASLIFSYVDSYTTRNEVILVAQNINFEMRSLLREIKQVESIVRGLEKR